MDLITARLSRGRMAGMIQLLPLLVWTMLAKERTALAATETPHGFTAPAIHAQALRQADSLYKRLKSPDAAYGSQELFIAMLAYAEANTNLLRIAEILPFAERMQERKPESNGYGNFYWYSRNAEVLDYNAVDFAMQYGALLWKHHQEKLPPDVRQRMRAMLELGLIGLQQHKVRPSYTNIALLNASDLILLGEALYAEAATREGEKRLNRFVRFLYEEGVHEFVSPTYYDVDVEALRLLEGGTTNAQVRGTARVLLDYFWTDIALNWFTPSDRLAGSHSRTYNYVYGFGSLDGVMMRHGWMSVPEKYSSSNSRVLYSQWQPSPAFTKQNRSYPRLVEQTWGSDPMCARTHYVCQDITLGTSWRNYGGRMDIPLAVDFPAPSRKSNQPRVSFIPDGRQDPYGTKKIFDGRVHDKAFHLSHFWAGVQDKADALALAIYRPEDFRDTTGTLDSHLLLPTAVDSVWVDDAPLACVTTNAIPLNASLFLRHGSAVLGIRIPWSRGHTAEPCSLSLVADNPKLHVMRLTVSHPVLPTNQIPVHLAGVALRLRIGSDITTDQAFATFRRLFRSESIQTHASGTGIVIRAANDGLVIHALAPYANGSPVRTIPAPPRTRLGCNGVDLGKALLEALPAIQEHKEQLKQNRVIPVSDIMGAQWEAEHGSMDVALTLAHDTSASNGIYLWEAEDAPGERAGGAGKVRYTLEVKKTGTYCLAGRFLSPTPDDDSFFVSVVTQEGTPVLTNTLWAVGVHADWSWSAFSLPRQAKPADIVLPRGLSTLILQTREAGTKVDQLRLRPSAR